MKKWQIKKIKQNKKNREGPWTKFLELQLFFDFHDSKFIKVHYCVLVLPLVHWFSFYWRNSDIEFKFLQNLRKLNRYFLEQNHI